MAARSGGRRPLPADAMRLIFPCSSTVTPLTPRWPGNRAAARSARRLAYPHTDAYIWGDADDTVGRAASEHGRFHRCTLSLGSPCPASPSSRDHTPYRVRNCCLERVVRPHPFEDQCGRYRERRSHEMKDFCGRANAKTRSTSEASLEGGGGGRPGAPSATPPPPPPQSRRRLIAAFRAA